MYTAILTIFYVHSYIKYLYLLFLALTVYLFTLLLFTSECRYDCFMRVYLSYAITKDFIHELFKGSGCLYLDIIFSQP